MLEINTIFTDLLVIGDGLAGLRAASAAAEEKIGDITVVSKGANASVEIMGFNVPVLPEDSIEQYVTDMQASGYGINRKSLAKVLAESVSGEVAYLEKTGMKFDKNADGSYRAIHTLGCKYPRLVHCESSTGVLGMKHLRERCEALNVKLHVPIDILGLFVDGGKVLGAFGIDLRSGRLVRYIAKAVVLATGGCGAIQKISTYPAVLVGDGYAMAYRAGTDLVDMEFQQFEPCAFVYPEKIAGKVIATTLLRHGARLLNGEMHEFMADYGLTLENVQKSTLARAIVAEVKAGRGTPHRGIYYDMTMLDEKLLYEDHKIFTEPALQVGMDLKKEMPEMMPAAHTSLGGVCISDTCATGIDGLFACGEVTGGLHGGNRLGGSSGAETMVFGAKAGQSAADHIKSGAKMPDHTVLEQVWKIEQKRIENSITDKKSGVSVNEIRRNLGELMSDKVSISRSEAGLKTAWLEVDKYIQKLKEATAKDLNDIAKIYHCDNMLLLAKMQIEASLIRKESRGVFFREDFPEQNDSEWRRNIMIRDHNGKMELKVCDCQD